MPAYNPFAHSDKGHTSAALSLVAITPSDTLELVTVVRRIYVGKAGTVSVTDTTGVTVVHTGVLAGTYLGPFSVAKVNATGTTAAMNLIGYV